MFCGLWWRTEEQLQRHFDLNGQIKIFPKIPYFPNSNSQTEAMNIFLNFQSALLPLFGVNGFGQTIYAIGCSL